LEVTAMPAPDPKTWAQNHLTRIAQSSFRVETEGGLVLAVDPFTPSAAWTKVDVVLVTHPHPDHFNAAVVRSLLKEGTRVVVPASVQASGADQGLATDALAPGETKIVGPITVTAVRAYNLGKPMHPRNKDWLGYVFTVDGLKVYHAGDTDLIPEMEDLTVDVALLPVGGLATMNATAAVQAARLVHAAVVVPVHYGKVPFTGGAGRKFAAAWSGITVLA
jgi:L-ascorbate metabolism protein UlaG (beta-lactamase superfamily)